MYYDKQIRYIDYMENGEKQRNCGYVKMTVADNRLLLEMRIKGLYETDDVASEVALEGAGAERRIGTVLIRQGSGEFRWEFRDAEHAGQALALGEGLCYGQLERVHVQLSPRRSLRCVWRETVSQSETAGREPDLGGYDTAWENAPGMLGQRQEAAPQAMDADGDFKEGREKMPDSGTGEMSVIQPVPGIMTGTEGGWLYDLETPGSVHETIAAEGRSGIRAGTTERDGEKAMPGIARAERDDEKAMPGIARAEQDRERAMPGSAGAERDDERTAPGRALTGQDGEKAAEGKMSAKWDHKAPEAGAPTEQGGKRATEETEELSPETETLQGKRQTPQAPPMVSMSESKWQQLQKIYPHIRPFQDEREYLSLRPEDFVILHSDSYRLVQNSFLLHGFYNYDHLILTQVSQRNIRQCYIGVPGNFYEKEKQVAIMYGFGSFECRQEPAQEGDFGYYMIKVEL